MNDKERRAIERAAKTNESAKNYLALLDACTEVLANSDGISLAAGLVGDRDEVYGQAVDDTLSTLMPVIYKASAAGWESLKYYVSEESEEQS